ncbi:hypothetical protein BJY14_008451 [Actinomadura luteofluorescens]|uniref:Uncharacterized protein n=1 Tax=Actinomadura luteofluorescens TaxID=46163 RepID=A0A7Y9ER83_9ACTN|nr:hypothetical protein [Actinomadura luteofluorescens]NYD52468.1 hypothetical protein [Actinomadura luteofluorescens]
MDDQPAPHVSAAPHGHWPLNALRAIRRHFGSWPGCGLHVPGVPGGGEVGRRADKVLVIGEPDEDGIKRAEHERSYLG